MRKPTVTKYVNLSLWEAAARRRPAWAWAWEWEVAWEAEVELSSVAISNVTKPRYLHHNSATVSRLLMVTAHLRMIILMQDTLMAE